MSIFPSMAQGAAPAQSTATLPIAKEVMWDYEKNIPVFRAGTPLYATGKDAVKVWAAKALHTRRFRHEIYTFSYGCDAYSLIGQTYTEQLKTTEAARYIRECLIINKYISDVRDIEVDFLDCELRISCVLDTIYGEERISV